MSYLLWNSSISHYFSCGHFECHSCYATEIKWRARRWNLKLFFPCPICRSDDIPENVSTANVELKRHPTSNVSIFYKNLQVRCRNRQCNRFIQYPHLTVHEICECPERNIKVSNTHLHSDQEELDTIIDQVKLNRGRLLFGLHCNTSI